MEEIVGTDWTHAEGEADHPVDPKYNGSGWMGGEQPSYWVCDKCRRPVLLRGGKVPITVPPVKVKPPAEPELSSQP